jgi:hypothetical protein
MKTQINYKKALLWGFIIWIAQMVFGNLLWINPIAIKINEAFSGHPSIKPVDFLGSMQKWIFINFLFSTFYSVICIILYVVLYNSIPGKGWRKGVFFGCMIGFFKAVPEAFNQWMVFVYPWQLIVLQLFNTIISLLFFGWLLGYLFDKKQVMISR